MEYDCALFARCQSRRCYVFFAIWSHDECGCSFPFLMVMN